MGEVHSAWVYICLQTAETWMVSTGKQAGGLLTHLIEKKHNKSQLNTMTSKPSRSLQNHKFVYTTFNQPVKPQSAQWGALHRACL